MNHPAFNFLRQFKEVSSETEALVLKVVQTKFKTTTNDILKAFEKGVSGEYGKFIMADPQTLINWVSKYLEQKNSSTSYLDSGLLDTGTRPISLNYPRTTDDWCKEANKCFTAFLNGVGCEYFHPHVYDRMMLDNKIQLNAYKKYCTDSGDGVDFGNDDETNRYFEEHIKPAKQKILRDIFAGYKSKGWSSVYIIPTA